MKRKHSFVIPCGAASGMNAREIDQAPGILARAVPR